MAKKKKELSKEENARVIDALRRELGDANENLAGLRAQVSRLESDNRNVSMVSKDRYWTIRKYEEGRHAFQQRLIDEMVSLHLRIIEIMRTLQTVGVDGRKILAGLYPSHTEGEATAGVKTDN